MKAVEDAFANPISYFFRKKLLRSGYEDNHIADSNSMKEKFSKTYDKAEEWLDPKYNFNTANTSTTRRRQNSRNTGEITAAANSNRGASTSRANVNTANVRLQLLRNTGEVSANSNRGATSSANVGMQSLRKYN